METHLFPPRHSDCYRSAGRNLRICRKPQVPSDAFANENALRLDVFNTILRSRGCQLTINALKNVSSSWDYAEENYSTAPRKVADPNLEVATERGNPR